MKPRQIGGAGFPERGGGDSINLAVTSLSIRGMKNALYIVGGVFYLFACFSPQSSPFNWRWLWPWNWASGVCSRNLCHGPSPLSLSRRLHICTINMQDSLSGLGSPSPAQLLGHSPSPMHRVWLLHDDSEKRGQASRRMGFRVKVQ